MIDFDLILFTLLLFDCMLHWYYMTFRPCPVCLSPWRSEIEGMYRDRKEIKTIALKYRERFPDYKNWRTVHALFTRHFKHQALASAIEATQVPNDPTAIVLPRTTLESLAQRLLDIGGKGIEFYEKNPSFASKLPLKYALDAQKLLIMRQRNQISENALKISLARMFGGFPLEMPAAVEGELVDVPDKPAGIIQSKT